MCDPCGPGRAITIVQGFSASALLALGAADFFAGGRPCTVQYLAASLAYMYPLDASCIPPCDDTKNVSSCHQISRGDKIAPAENHWLSL